MNIFTELSKKSYKHYYEGTIEELDLMDKNNPDLHSEIMQVIMWLYEKHHKYISIINEPNIHSFKWIITNLTLVGYQRYVHSNKLEEMNNNETEYLRQHYFKSPTEAYEAAIKYCLENLV